MNIILIGYGKMGKAIEKIALERGHHITLRISSSNIQELTPDNMRSADVAIEFTNPEVAFDNVMSCISAQLPVVSGSTGWNEQLELAKKECIKQKSALLQASNFSVGVNLFFKLNQILAELMNPYPEYDVAIEETHHTHKKDAPSGTAITIAELILERLKRKSVWVKEVATQSHEMAIKAHRIDEVPGTHIVKYSSAIDDIEISHTAHNRDGFAMGAVLAAEFIYNKKGIFNMVDVLGL
jgi:4-hydroxy-tetrahydrodipicolinate reductase